jgi:hypothetical protein
MLAVTGPSWSLKGIDDILEQANLDDLQEKGYDA